MPHASEMGVAGLSEQECREVVGRIFNVQPYSIHDGPGIRTTVFVNGCPLSCRWCQNPESWTMEPKLFFMAERCTGCGACVAACPKDAVRVLDGVAHTDRTRCDACGLCVDECRAEARWVEGRQVTAGEVADQVLADKLFMQPDGGGVTISGGEVLTQPRFAAAVLRLCREQGVTTCIETCGMGSQAALDAVLEQCDLVLFDFKHMDPAEHEWGTGVSNQQILHNARYVHCQMGKPVWARIPVIPGYNDSDENIAATCRFLCDELGGDVPVNLLPYHNFGDSKRDRMEQPGEGRFAPQRPDDARMAQLKALVESFGLTCRMGG